METRHIIEMKRVCETQNVFETRSSLRDIKGGGRVVEEPLDPKEERMCFQKQVFSLKKRNLFPLGVVGNWKPNLLLLGSLLLLCVAKRSQAQTFEAGVEYTYGKSYTTFQGNLKDIVGFDELEITEADIDTAFTNFDLSAPRWIKDLFPGLRLEVDQEISKRLTRNNNAARFYARFSFVGGSFMISEPRLSEQAASKMLGNQLRSLRYALGGNSEALTKHLADIALAESKQVNPFFSKRYDLELYLHTKKLFLGEEPLLKFGNNSYLDAELTTGVRFTADPSPIVELGSVLFISQRIDSLLEGGLLRPVENTTDQIAEAIQSTVFGKFKDPRIISSMGWFVRGEIPINFGQNFSFVPGVEMSLNKHLAVANTKPMFSIYGFVGLRWSWQTDGIGKTKKRR